MNKDAEGNIHLAEERNQLRQKDYEDKEQAKGFDEEMKYSGVYR